MYTPCRRAGWEDADTELLEAARHRRWLPEGRGDGWLGTRRLLYDAGHTARQNGVAFEEGSTEPWNAGWVAADILIDTILIYPARSCAEAAGVAP